MLRTHALRLCAGSAYALATTRPSLAQTSTVRFGTVPTETNGQLFYATDTGIFKSDGIDAVFTYSNNLSVTMAALVAGSLDVTSIDPIALTNAINHGAQLVIIAGGALYETSAPATLLCVAKSSPIRTAKDLEGHAVGVIKLGGISYTAVRAWLTQNGADATKIQFFELPAPQMLPALERGTVAAVAFIEPELHGAKNDVRTLGKPYDAMAKELLISVWVAQRDWVAQNTELARRVAGALYAASAWANVHQDESLLIIAKYAKIDPDALRGMARARYATRVQRSWLQPVIDTAVAAGVLEHGIDLGKVIATL